MFPHDPDLQPYSDHGPAVVFFIVLGVLIGALGLFQLFELLLALGAYFASLIHA